MKHKYTKPTSCCKISSLNDNHETSKSLHLLSFIRLIDDKLLLSVCSGHLAFWKEAFHIVSRLRLHASHAATKAPRLCQFSAFAAISEVMTGNRQQGDLNEQTRREHDSEASACSTGALHPPPPLHTVDIMGGWNEGTSWTVQHALSCALTRCQSHSE